MKGCNQYFVYINDYKFSQFVSKDKCGGEGGEQLLKIKKVKIVKTLIES